ncbi:hypothetical protein LUZ63_006973 [Rhynchospora breviuscula]|uniref:Protein kinase domain-containing protein n=1 Tax=Rhynchospora breviuscula TaxID=2022672 RepID=A0A9Q0CR04_9POAL|nr:hypothetical protein LUZ63_006973 [Rhynchospora breviuscula]
MGILNYTKRNGKKLLKCFCYAEFSKKKQQNALPPSHFHPQQQSQVPEEKKKNIRIFWRKKKREKGNNHQTNINNKTVQHEEQHQQAHAYSQPERRKERKKSSKINKKEKRHEQDANNTLANLEKRPLKQPKDKKKKKNKKRKLLWRWKKQKKEPNILANLVNTLAMESDIQTQRYAAQEILRIGNENIPSRVFTFNQLKAATENFNDHNLIGEGGFGRVFKGHIQETNEAIAVKVLDQHGIQGNREFLVEVLMLSLLHHPNLVSLYGYCVDNNQRILVYEYMAQGSLQDHLLDCSRNHKPLNWETRMKIATGAAKGLEYLHDMANPPVIYRDLKTSNILLGNGFDPKLSDFGLAKLGPTGEKTHVTTRVMGTYGYCAPEYAMTGKLTKMSDIYSFGVVMLELITGRKAVDTTRPTREQVLVQWATPLFKDKKNFTKMVDPLLEGEFPLKSLYQAVAIAALCLSEEPTSRPVISDVVSALEFIAIPKAESLGSSGELSPPALHPSYSDLEIFETCESSEDL